MNADTGGSVSGSRTLVETEEWGLKEYKWKGSFFGWFVGLVVLAQETYVSAALISQYKIFSSSSDFNLCVPIAQQPGQAVEHGRLSLNACLRSHPPGYLQETRLSLLWSLLWRPPSRGVGGTARPRPPSGSASCPSRRIGPRRWIWTRRRRKRSDSTVLVTEKYLKGLSHEREFIYLDKNPDSSFAQIRIRTLRQPAKKVRKTLISTTYF